MEALPTLLVILYTYAIIYRYSSCSVSSRYRTLLIITIRHRITKNFHLHLLDILVNKSYRNTCKYTAYREPLVFMLCTHVAKMCAHPDLSKDCNWLV